METDLLAMRHINKHYAGVQALQDVDFSLRRGEIHCLAGTNGSGKSTLVKIICGVEQPDEGSEILIQGQPYQHLTRKEALRQGIQVIYQDLSLFPNLSVQENISFGETMAQASPLVCWKRGREVALKAMEKMGMSLPLDKKVGNLSMGDQQLVAIARALTHDVALLIMDEPTTALTKKEVDALLLVISDLRKRDIATLFISHKLKELMQVADRVTILRDGRNIGCWNSSELDDKIIELHMTGTNAASSSYQPLLDTQQTPVLELEGWSKQHNFADINLTIRHKEVIGITGLLGSGRTELALSLFGLNPPDTGTCRLCGKPVHLDSVEKAVDQGIAYVPENRLAEGLVLDQPIANNITMTILDQHLSSMGLLDEQALHTEAEKLVERLHIRLFSPDFAVKTLSGGNQQRVVLAKWMATNPKLFILDNPTVGIDVAAKASIHAFIRELAQQGMAIIVISDEIAEVVNNCNRVLVMNRGRIIGEFVDDACTEEQIQAFIDQHAV